MASILKVDTLQKPDGSTPTAADLGLNVAGSVVGYGRHDWTSATIGTSASYIDMASSSFSYTPKSSNSILVVTMNISIYLSNASNAGMGLRVDVDGVGYGTPATTYEYYSADSSSHHWHVTKVIEVPNNSLTAKTIKGQFRAYDASDANISPDNLPSSITVFEIAQ